jgi:hypothetical protein
MFITWRGRSRGEGSAVKFKFFKVIQDWLYFIGSIITVAKEPKESKTSAAGTKA